MSTVLMWGGRLGLGGLMLYAAYAKLSTGWITFAMVIEAHQILPPAGVEFVARWLPWGELILGAGLIVGWGLRWFAAATSFLLLVFFVVLSRSYALGLQVECGCWGPGDLLTWKTLVRDGLLLAASLALTIAAFRTHGLRKAGHTEVAEPQPRQA